MTSPTLRRTRILCISDTHNSTVKLPDGDVLIHAGDLTNQGSYTELSRAVQWLESTKFEAKIVIAGNHDIGLDEAFCSQHGSQFHNKNPQSHADCLSLLTSSPSITYLDHSSTTVRLASPCGPRTEFRIFGSPYSPRCGLWAFSYDQTAPWDDIPITADIVVTHTPARNHRDTNSEGRNAGCEALRRALSRVRPRLAICGHVHPGRGAHRVSWDLSSDPDTPEQQITPWEDPSPGPGSKMSLIDLTGRRSPVLANDGSSKGRGETCIVNAAIVRTNYPHVGGKQFNKPIVIDVDLPVWEEEDTQLCTD